MVRKSEKALGTVFFVPNNEEGQLFIRNLRRYLNRAHYKIRIRGRNENRKQFVGERGGSVRQFVPVRMASYFAVYIDSRGCDRILNESRIRHYAEVARVRSTVEDLRRNIHYLEVMHDAAKARLSVAEGQLEWDKERTLRHTPRRIRVE